MAKKKYTPMSEFQTNKVTGHPSFLFQKQGKFRKSIGLTHDDKEDYGKKHRLTKNPNPNDNRITYVKDTIEIQKENKYKRDIKYKDWHFADADKPLIDTLKKKK